MSERIQLVEDDASLQLTLGAFLRSLGYDVESARRGFDALEQFSRRPADLIVLDLGLPDIEGAEVCRRIRAVSPVPIIVLSAREDEASKIGLLEAGADDYVTKPFKPGELVARIRVALRRTATAGWAGAGRVRCGEITVDYDQRRCRRGRDEIRLTPKEFELLGLLLRYHDRVVPHREILSAIWGPNAVDQPEHLWVLVGQLRKKIEPDPVRPRYLVSEPWVGYRLVTMA